MVKEVKSGNGLATLSSIFTLSGVSIGSSIFTIERMRIIRDERGGVGFRERCGWQRSGF